MGSIETVSRFATCSWPDCHMPAVRGGSCSACQKHLCRFHSNDKPHRCIQLDDESWETSIHDEVSTLLSRLNRDALTRIASRLNGNKPCRFEPGQYLGSGAIMGCANYHAWIVFPDGERWLARVPRTGFSDVPPELVEYIVKSEYATLKFLEKTNVPAPKAFGYGLASDPSNPVGLSYLVIEALPGRPYNAHKATPEQTSKVLEQAADIMAELSRYKFDRAGSLIMTKPDGRIDVGEIASNRFLHLGRHGPFSNAVEYLGDTASQYLELISDGQLFPQAPFGAYFFYKLVQKHASKVSGQDNSGEFFLKHVDDKGDHILVDDEYNIVGIIDWQFARTVPACEAFGPSLLTANMGGMYSGQSSMSGKDLILGDALRRRGFSTLASHMDRGDLVRRAQFGVPGGLSRSEVRDILGALLEALGYGQLLDVDRWVQGKTHTWLGDTASDRRLLKSLGCCCPSGFCS
ncbi:hypothetical protein QBC44DRAFT_335714 [Cladorrhinum sp. PSN332]|nr:hypothetical protein QBC44DRAFT_335714 [Cladorrhinum sp. PSN332]